MSCRQNPRPIVPSRGWTQDEPAPIRNPPPPRPAAVLVGLACACLVLIQSIAYAKVDVMITAVKIEGNSTISTEKILGKIKSRQGRMLDEKTVDADIKALSKMNLFSNVAHRLEPDPSGKGSILIFRVWEFPILTNVEFRGRTRWGIKLKEIENTTGLKKGERFDFVRNGSAAGQIQELYKEAGFHLAEVRLIKGGHLGDGEVIISIFEGPKFQIDHVDFQGNTFATDAVLLTKVTNKRKWFGLLPGAYQTDLLEEDVRKLKEYYEGNGFLISKASWIVRPTPGGGLGSLTLTFVVEEGIQYHINQVKFEGTKRKTPKELDKVIKLRPGMAYNEPLKELDLKNIQIAYNELGCIKTQINARRMPIDNKKGLVDLVWQIVEGEPYEIGEIIVRGNNRTQDRVIRREANQAGLVPTEPLNRNRIDLFRQRLANLGYFQNNPEQGKPIDIQIINERTADKPYADTKAPLADSTQVNRGQSPEDNPAPGQNRAAGGAAGAANLNDEPPASGAGSAFPYGLGDPFEPAPNQLPQPLPFPDQGQQPQGGGRPFGPADQSPYPNQSRTPPVNQGVPPGIFPPLPGGNMTNLGPDRQEPFSNRSIADVLVQLDELSTGRFSFGFGASSYQGLFAQLTLVEQNFDLLKVPKSLDDIFNMRSFRGAGQQLNVMVMAGTLINQAQVSLLDPYLFDLPISGSVLGSAFTRIYPDWLEKRIGVKTALGRQFGTSIYADVSFTAENIDFYGYRTPAPAAYLAASGNTFLTSIRPTLRYDNRNSPFSPSSGEYVEASVMQAWGSFNFAQATLEGRKYYTLGSRPDGTGKRTLLFRGVYGVSGKDTPVYERFFAGDFRSFRGFWYRGVGPHIFGANVGGFTEALGSIEYMIPLTANDRIHQVFFCDYGTINQSYSLGNFRAAIGTGLRIQIPGVSALPFSLDIAFPILKQPGDITRFFSFNVGGSF